MAIAESEIDPISARRIRDVDDLLARERDARQLLEAEKAVRERLLALMTRELVTQANIAKGWLHLLRRERLDGATREVTFSKVDTALTTQLSLLDELVGMTPAAAGHVNLDCRRVDVAAVARAVAADVGDERAHVVATEPAIILADVEHLIRALRALISATTRQAQFVDVVVTASGDVVRVRFSSPIHDDDDALPVARRVAELYGGAITVMERHTIFELPAVRD